MKKLLTLLVLISVLACSERKSEEIYQGKLQEFVSGSFIIEKDSTTGRLDFQKIIDHDGKRFFVSREDQGYSLFNAVTGKKEFTFKIPKEGPLSLKGHAVAYQVFDGNEFIAVSSQGNVKKYISGVEVKEMSLDWTDYQEKMLIQMSDTNDNFIKIDSNRYQLFNNPFDIFNDEKSVDLDYREWVVEFDLEEGWVCASDLKAPLGEEFSNSTSASHLKSVYNGNLNQFYLMFAPSDTLYQIQNCKVLRKIALESVTEFKYLPGLYEQNGRNKNWKNNPTSAGNTSLNYDSNNELYIRMVLMKTEETQPEIKDIRERTGLNKSTFILLVYDLGWRLKAELELFYDAGQSSGNIIASKEGIFITKTEQKSEDEYEFYKIDLSRFGDN
jgi:hypothetical protein